MAIYEIINVGANKALNIYGSDVKGNTLYDGRSIILWTSSGSGEQCWIVPSLRSAPYIRSYLNRDFGIHANKNGTSKYACDIHTITGSADTKIALTEVSNGYKIKLEGENMYLTANGTGNGASVSWAPSSTSNMQVWKFNRKDVISNGRSTTLYGDVGTMNDAGLSGSRMEKNAQYIYDFLRDEGFTKEAACAVLGNFESESTFNPAIWENLNVISGNHSGYGIAQWTPATYFLQWAVDVGLITTATASQINRIAESSIRALDRIFRKQCGQSDAMLRVVEDAVLYEMARRYNNMAEDDRDATIEGWKSLGGRDVLLYKDETSTRILKYWVATATTDDITLGHFDSEDAAREFIRQNGYAYGNDGSVVIITDEDGEEPE